MKQKYLWIIVAVAVAIWGIALLRQDKTGKENQPDSPASAQENLSVEENQNTAKPATAAKKLSNTAQSSVGLSYEQALKEYLGRRIQFDQNCKATPSYVTFTSGTKIMLDNRSPLAKTFLVGPNSYHIAAYGFAVITLTSNTLPQTFYINCGQLNNAARILVQ